MFKKLNIKYIDLLVTGIAIYLVTLTFYGTEYAKDYIAYPFVNSKLDSLQSKKIRQLEASSKEYCTIKEFREQDSSLFEILKDIKSNQTVFQNKVIERYDDKCNILTEKLTTTNLKISELNGVLKGRDILYVDSLFFPGSFFIVSKNLDDSENVY